MTDAPPPDLPPPDLLRPSARTGPSLVRLAGTGIVVLLLIALGVMTGARLWPNVTTVERRVVAPIRTPRAPTPQEQLPDLVDAACPGVVRLLLAAPAAQPVPAPSPTPAGRHRRRGHHRAATAPSSAPAPAPLPLNGVLVSDDGYLVTSAERLDAAPGPVTALLGDGRRLEAARVASDPLSGLALLKLDATDLPFLQFADDGLPRTGSWGFGLSAPGGTGCAARTGIVAADSIADAAPLRSFIRVAANAPAGAEGAPFLDAGGQVMGIAAFRSADDADAGTDLMLPGTVAAQVTDAMIRNGKPPPSPFGVYAADLDPVLARRLGAERLRGAAVLLVQPGSPADRAGLRAGDVVVAAGGAPVSGAAELARALDPDADRVALDVSRRGENVSLVIAP